MVAYYHTFCRWAQPQPFDPGQIDIWLVFVDISSCGTRSGTKFVHIRALRKITSTLQFSTTDVGTW